MVFGKVVEGMAVVKRIEAAGSKSGRTAQRITIASCGELASRRKIMAQLEAEKVRPMPHCSVSTTEHGRAWYDVLSGELVVLLCSCVAGY